MKEQIGSGMSGDQRQQAIDAIRKDSVSSASELLPRAIELLRSALDDRDVLTRVVRQICAAQPCMASLWNACAAALEGGESLVRFEAQSRRAPAAIARVAADLLSLDRDALRVATWSSSVVVRETVLALSKRARLMVRCAEGRPMMEGESLARALATRVDVELYTDAGLLSVVADCDAVLCGADAVTPSFFINKVGTGTLLAVAQNRGIPGYVLAGRDKFVPADVADRLALVDETPVTPAFDGVRFRNPVFERFDPRSCAAVVNDAAVLDPGLLVGACSSRPGHLLLLRTLAAAAL
jgi:translation initiation factor 2B subunit (eIF-2B alpha/beta/delta family)